MRDIDLSDLEPHPQQEHGKKSDENDPVAFIPEGRKIQGPGNKIRDHVQPEAVTQTLWRGQPACRGVIYKRKKRDSEKPDEKDDL